VVVLTPAYTNRLPTSFDDPERFDPQRFLVPDPEERARRLGSLLTFGAGAHACLGAALAPIEMKAILAATLRRFDLRLLRQDRERSVYRPAGAPASGARIAYKRVV
jgi:sterol 14-demethylase